MASNQPTFREPTSFERFFNRIVGFLIGIGIGFSYNYLLQVRGRKTGRIYSTPIDLLTFHGKPYLVAPRGRTQWVQNAEAAGEITLKRGTKHLRFRLRAVGDSEKPAIIKSYVEAFKATVQRYFSVPAGSEPSAFAGIASRHPVFELIPLD